MVNWIKRVEKFDGNDIAADDAVVAVGFLQPGGELKRVAVSGGLGGIIGALIGARMSKKADEKARETSSEMAQAFPGGPVIVAVTAKQRIIVYKQDVMSGKPKELLTEYQKGDFYPKDLKKGSLKHDLTLTFKDGGELGFDLARGQDPDAFVQALQ